MYQEIIGVEATLCILQGKGLSYHTVQNTISRLLFLKMSGATSNCRYATTQGL